MELKTARLTLLIEPNTKAAFERLCALQDVTPSQVVRQLIRAYLAQHDVSFVGSRPVEPAVAPKATSRSERPAVKSRTRRRKA
jgi:hypothetical protein